MTDRQITIQAHSLSKSYQGRDSSIAEGTKPIQVLDSIDLTVERGEVVALMGPSGSGKSTLLNILGLLESPDTGSLAILQKKVNFSDGASLVQMRRRDLGFVFQSFNLISTLTVEENIKLPLLLLRVPAKMAEPRVTLLLEKTGLTRRRKHLPAQLSGGEMQRVAVCRALVHQPSIILADEPTGNLDGETASAVITLLKEASVELNCSILVATHSQEAAERCTRTVHLHYGTLNSGTLNSGTLNSGSLNSGSLNYGPLTEAPPIIGKQSGAAEIVSEIEK